MKKVKKMDAQKIIDELKSDIYILDSVKRAFIVEENWEGLIWLQGKRAGSILAIQIVCSHSDLLDFEEITKNL